MKQMNRREWRDIYRHPFVIKCESILRKQTTMFKLIALIALLGKYIFLQILFFDTGRILL